MAQSSNEVNLGSSHFSDNASSLDDDSMQIEYNNLCELSLKIINKNKILKTKRELLEKEILELNEKIKKLERNKEVDIGCESSQQLHLENAKLKETQVKFVKFDQSANSLKEMLNVQRLPSCKIGLGFDMNKASTSGTKQMSFVRSVAVLAGDGSTIKADGFTVPESVDLRKSLNVTFDESPPPTKLSPLVDDDVGEEEAIRNTTKVVNNKNEEDESIEVDEVVNIKESKNHPLDQHDEFDMSMMGELNFFLGLQIKQMEDGIFFNQSKYIKEMLKKFGLEDFEPTKTSMPTEIKLTKDDEADSVDSSKYRVYFESDHSGDYVDRKSTSGVCTFMGCCLTSWFAKKQTALAISMIEAEYVSATNACQQARWMKQALIDYDIRLDDVPIMCDNKGAIDLSKNPVQHSRTKHIEIRHHFLRDNVQKGNISIKKVESEDNIADIFTKPLKREVFNYLRLGLGMMELIMDSDSPSSKK
ncbi:copia protein [Tanacetum coccineum]